MADIKAVVFDAYGTLLDFHSAMQRHSGRIGGDWQGVSELWRVKQIEYTWVRTMAGDAEHLPFSAVTEQALDFVLASKGLSDGSLKADLLAAYRELDAYEDVVPTLQRLRTMGLPRAILSNGDPEMLAAGVKAANIGGLLDDVLSVETVGAFKPDGRVYQMAAERFSAAPGEIAFLSSNAWDAYGASVFGFRVFWVNRRKQPVEYGLDVRATVIPALASLPDLLT